MSHAAVALAVLAHPDDAEFLCAGTLIRLGREQGYQIHIATLTAGDCGSTEQGLEETAAIRRAEGGAAAAVIHAQYHCLDERDMRVMYTEATLEKVVRLLNRVRPSVVFTHSPDDYHVDHEATSRLVRGATFAAPIPNFLHGQPDAESPLDRIPHLYYCDALEGKDLLGRVIEPAVRVDISGAIDDKSAMLACHVSQRAWLRKHHGVDDLVDSMRAWSAHQGEAAGFAFAEGFRQHKGHSYPQACLLGELLGADGRGV